MNLQETVSTIKKLWLPMSGLLLLTAFSVWWIYIREPVAENGFGEIKPPQIDSVVSGKLELRYSVAVRSSSKLPKVTSVYEKAPRIEAETIAEKLGFKGAGENISGQLLWKTNLKTLKFKLPSSRFSFTNKEAVKEGNLSKEEAVDTAERVLRSLGLLSLTKGSENLEMVDFRYLLSKKTEAAEVGSSRNFNIYSISYGLKFGSFETINESGSQELIEIWIGKDGSLQKIEADSQPLVTVGSSTYKIKPLKTAQNELKEGKGVIVSLGGQVSSTAKIEIRYTIAQLSYFFGLAAEKYLQPVYLFKGVVIGRSGLTDVEAVLPALAE